MSHFTDRICNNPKSRQKHFSNQWPYTVNPRVSPWGGLFISCVLHGGLFAGRLTRGGLRNLHGSRYIYTVYIYIYIYNIDIIYYI